MADENGQKEARSAQTQQKNSQEASNEDGEPGEKSY